MPTNDKIISNLFISEAELPDTFTDSDIQRKRRIMLCVSKKMEDPILADKELVAFLTNGGDGTIKPISKSQAYRDIQAINKITGNIQMASRDWHRYMVVETAKNEISKWKGKDGRAVASLLKIISSTLRLEQDEKENNFDLLVAPNYEITGDISALEIPEPDQDFEKQRRELRKLYKANVVDVEIDEIQQNDNEQ